VAERKPFLLQIVNAVVDAVQRWANDDLAASTRRSSSSCRDALRRTGRLSRPTIRSFPDHPIHWIPDP